MTSIAGRMVSGNVGNNVCHFVAAQIYWSTFIHLAWHQYPVIDELHRHSFNISAAMYWDWLVSSHWTIFLLSTLVEQGLANKTVLSMM